LDEEIGILEIPLKPGVISILDGQQRTGGFEEIYREIKNCKLNTPYPKPRGINQKITRTCLSFEIPIVFV